MGGREECGRAKIIEILLKNFPIFVEIFYFTYIAVLPINEKDPLGQKYRPYKDPISMKKQT